MLNALEMWYCRKMQRIIGTERRLTEDVLRTTEEKRTLIGNIKRRG